MKKYSLMLVSIIIAAFAVSFLAIPSERTMAKSDLPEAAQKRLANAVVLYIGSNDAYKNNVKTRVDENVDVCPVSENGRTLVPVRFISESLGAKVDWDKKTSTVIINYKNKKITMVMGKKVLSANGKEFPLEVSAKEINNRTFVPFRAIAEAFGKKVFYDRGLIVISDKDNLFNSKTEKSLLDGIISKVNNLPAVGSEANLKKIIEKFKTNQNSKEYISFDRMVSATAQSAKSMNTAKNETLGGSSDYSKTNVQVEGVDEADIVKTDGKYIYQVNRQRIVVAEVYPADNMKVRSTVEFTDKSFNPSEIYVDGNKMIVIGSTYQTISCKTQAAVKDGDYRCPSYSPQFAKAIVYDITDKSNIKKIKDFAIEGSIVSSRRIGETLYVVTNKYINYYYFEQNLKENLTPMFYDSALHGKERNLDCSKIRCFPGCLTPNYMVIASIDLDKIGDAANIQSYLGCGEQIYCSENNLYVAVTENEAVYDNVKKVPGSTGIVPPIYRYNQNTKVYKFSLDKGNVTYIAKGSVPGNILNQFSMDESDGNFRIATTTGHVSRNGDATSKNNLYVLNDTMSQIGKIEDIAPGERIYSVRFMGDRAYMVTFQKVDPLFVIDLKNPAAPKILGKLKIPGYSDYLHPYDENHIIGFGKDTIEAKEGTFAWYQGLKLAMFDVTDVSNPKEMFKEIIGDRGTDSELLNNHKALLFSKEKNLLAFPVTLMEIKNKEQGKMNGDYPQYGEFTFQGAYVYNVDLKNGFKLKARITHISDGEYEKSGNYWYDSNNNVERILYIANNLYTLSQGMFKAHDLGSFKEISSLEIK